MKTDLLILDGRHLLWRTSDAFRELTVELNGKTMPTGGIYGFLSCALRIHSKYSGKTVVAWEGTDNFRLDLFPKYKGKDEESSDERKELISEMAFQEGQLSELLVYLGVDQYWGKGCEADDVIGRLAKEARDRGESALIFSGDSDLRQLVREGVVVVSPAFRKDSVYNAPEVEEKHGVPPSLLAQLKAIAGDHSDKIPGAPGVGPVTAAKLLNHYGSLKKVLAAAEQQASDWPETERRRALIAGAADQIRLYYKLTRIREDMPWKRRSGSANQRQVVEAFKLYRFRSLMMPAELHGLMALGKGRKNDAEAGTARQS